MRVAYVYDTVPNTEHSTDTTCAYLLLRAMSEASHRVRAFLLLPAEPRIGDVDDRRRRMRRLEGMDVDVTVLPGDPPGGDGESSFLARGIRRLGCVARPSVEDFFPHALLRPRLEGPLRSFDPDVVFVWGNWPALAATHELRGANKFAFMGDPPHLPDWYRTRPPFVDRWRTLSPRIWLTRLHLWRRAQMARRLLQDCTRVAATAAHHAEGWQDQGIDCQYLPNVVPDWGGENWRPAWEQTGRTPGEPLQLLHVGNVTSTVNYAGLRFLADDVLPLLARELEHPYEVHLCGGGEPDAALSRGLDREEVVVRGWVEDIVEEVRRSDVYLVPTPIELGIRVRIPYAWSAGACVVAHTANARGLPELKHGENCLLADDPAGFSREVARVSRDPDLRERLIEGGRRTYEKRFSYEETKQRFLEELREAAGREQDRDG